ncbi:MAG: hypothetical protein IJC14_04740 [Firmicutes bacterium]|nr:hypothetical protein [Bacillota bacterium]
MTIMKRVKPEYIVYCSNAGHTHAYAKLFAEETGLPLIKIDEALKKLPEGSKIIFFGWVQNNIIQGYKQIREKKFDVCAVVSVSMFGRGSGVKALRNVAGVDWEIPFFPLKGGADPGRLGLTQKMMYKTFTAKKMRELKLLLNPTPLEMDMMRTIERGKSTVKARYLDIVLDWYNTGAYEEQDFEDDFSNEYKKTKIDEIDENRHASWVASQKKKLEKEELRKGTYKQHADGYMQRGRTREEWENLDGAYNPDMPEADLSKYDDTEDTEE